MIIGAIDKSEALPVDNAVASFLIFCLGDPHGLEGGQGRKDGASDPDKELSLERSKHLNLHCGGGEGSHFLAESFGNSGEESGSTAHNNVGIEIFTDVDITFHDGLVGDLVEAGHLLADLNGLEESLRTSEFLVAYGDALAIGKLVLSIVLAVSFVF